MNAVSTLKELGTARIREARLQRLAAEAMIIERSIGESIARKMAARISLAYSQDEITGKNADQRKQQEDSLAAAFRSIINAGGISAMASRRRLRREEAYEVARAERRTWEDKLRVELAIMAANLEEAAAKEDGGRQ